MSTAPRPEKLLGSLAPLAATAVLCFTSPGVLAEKARWNLVPAGDFEGRFAASGLCDRWTGKASRYASSPGRAGGAGQKCDIDAAPTTANWQSVLASGRFTVEPGAKYRVTAWCRAKDVWALQIRFRLHVADGSADMAGRTHVVKDGVLALDGRHRVNVDDHVSKKLLLISPLVRERDLPAEAAWDWIAWHHQHPATTKSGSWKWERWSGTFDVPKHATFYFGVVLPPVEAAQVVFSCRPTDRPGSLWADDVVVRKVP